MTEIDVNHPLVGRIAALRQRVRLVLALYGMGIVVAALGAAALVLPFFDYLLHLSPAVRVGLLALVVVGVGVLVYRRLVQPLSARLTDQFLASRVELVNRPLADELISALYFIRAGSPRRNVLAAQAVQKTEAEAAGVRFEDALSFRGAGRALLGAAALLAVLAGAAALNVDLARTAFARWTDPFGAHDWPRTTDVQFEWPDGKPPAVYPIGDVLTVRARVTRGFSDGLRVSLYSAADNARETRDIMNFQAGQSDRKAGQFIYEKRIEPTGEAAFYLRLTAADDNEQPAVKIRLAPRPEIAALHAAILPPAYAMPAPGANAAAAKSYDLLSEVGRAVEGSSVQLTIKTTKPIGTLANGEPDVNLQEAARDAAIPLDHVKRRLVDATTAELTFSAHMPLDFRVQVRDVDGFDNRVSASARLDVVPDGLPTVVLTEPRRPMEVVADAVIPVQIQSTDDLGLTEVFLQADNFDAGAAGPTTLPATASPGSPPAGPALASPTGSRLHQALTWDSQTIDPATRSVSGIANTEWNLAPLNLKPGDRLSFYGMVRDNYAVALAEFPGGAAAVKDPFVLGAEAGADSVMHRYVKSAPLSVMIQTRERIEEAARKDLQEVRDQIRRLADQQDLTNQQTKAIEKAAKDAGVTTPQQRQQLSELAGQQANQAQRAMSIQGRAEQIREGMRINKMDDTDLGKIARDVSAGMKDVGGNNMPKAASELSKAQEAAGRKSDAANPQTRKDDDKKAADETAAATGKADEQQQMALSTMGKLVDMLGAAGDFEAHRAKVNEILAQQKELEKQLRDQAAKTLGTPLDQLPAQDKANLDKIAANQEKLAQETSKLTDAMQRSSEQLARNDPASSDSLQKAVEASRNNNVSGNQSSAAGSAGQNQMSNSASAMTAARKGLEEMRDELDKQNRRQLEQLVRQIEELLDSLKKTRAAQLALNGETTKAGEKAPRETLEPLGNRQSRLQGNTLADAQRAEAIRNGRPVALDLHDAADAMGASTAALLKTAQPESLEPEKGALAALDKAIEKLEKQKKDAQDQLKDQDLAALRKQYEQIKTDQETVKTASDALAKKLQGHDPDRGDLSALATQATAQGKLIDDVNKLSQVKELQQYEVVLWINQQIIENMTDSKTRLGKAQVGEQVATAQQNALDRLQDIIDALKEEQGKKSEFQNQGGGGGGGGKPPLLPPYAQLKLLKSQQVIVNKGTADADAQLEKATAESDKNQLRENVDKLGGKQDKIQEMATKVVEGMKRQ